MVFVELLIHSLFKLSILTTGIAGLHDNRLVGNKMK